MAKPTTKQRLEAAYAAIRGEKLLTYPRPTRRGKYVHIFTEATPEIEVRASRDYQNAATLTTSIDLYEDEDLQDLRPEDVLALVEALLACTCGLYAEDAGRKAVEAA